MEKLLLSTPSGKGHIYSFPFPQAEKYREYILNLELDHHPKIFVFGRECHQNRDVRFFSDESKGYTYSGVLTKSHKLTPELKEILKTINSTFKDTFNGILINRYADGTEYIGAHRDNEASLGNSGVVGLVFGATRKLRIRDYKTKRIVADLEIPDGYVYHMDSVFNQEFTHEIPQEKRVSGSRTSLTFRTHK